MESFGAGMLEMQKVASVNDVFSRTFFPFYLGELSTESQRSCGMDTTKFGSTRLTILIMRFQPRNILFFWRSKMAKMMRTKVEGCEISSEE